MVMASVQGQLAKHIFQAELFRPHLQNHPVARHRKMKQERPDIPALAGFDDEAPLSQSSDPRYALDLLQSLDPFFGTRLLKGEVDDIFTSFLGQ